MFIYSPVHTFTFGNLPPISIKRDDLIDPYLSGNKWRKLKYILEHAKQLKKSHLVTFGGAYSNHLLATAAAAARFGFTATAFVRGEDIDNEVLFLCRLFGMELRFVDRSSYSDKPFLFEHHFRNHAGAYFIDEGGASEEAVKGCSEILAGMATYDHIFCAAGTGTTAAGILRYLNAENLDSKLHVVAALKGGSFLRNEIEKYTCDLSRLHVHTDYHFGGYAKSTRELTDFIKDFVRHTGIVIEPVYTAKMLYALIDLGQKGYFKEDDRILAIHTGGLIGLMGTKGRFS